MDDSFIKLLGSFIAFIIGLGTLIYKFWTDRKSSKERLDAELRGKTSEQYLEFLIKFSNFLNNTKSLKDKKIFLNLCYKMILVCNDDLKKEIETLLKLTLEYSEGTKISSYDSFKDELRAIYLIENIISLMRQDINKNNISKSKTDWIAAIEFLTVDLKEELDDQSTSTIKYYWINSNEKYSGNEVYKEMINKNVACTYGPKEYGDKLLRINEGDYIYLYLSGAGIIASGIVNKEYSRQANVKKFTNSKNESLEEYSIGVEWKFYVEPFNAITAKEIRAIGHSLFVPTVMRISEHIGKELDSKLSQKVNKQGVNNDKN